ncbi:MAG: hypothetical protein RIS83_1042 [Pseudomonadota bacterium]|jgi:apolipoprotein D and lipocalin family protein
MKMRLWLMAGLCFLAACATEPNATTPKTVGQVDLSRYAGLWHEVARLPTSFQDSARVRCEAVTAQYQLRPDGAVDVLNRCRNAAAGGQERSARAVAYSASPGNDRLRVSFFWPFFGDYWVIGLSPDYRWAVVGAPGRDYLWILSRDPVMAEDTYAEAVAIAAREGFPVTQLQRTVQP